MRYDGHFRLAHELGKHLHEVMGWDCLLTHRQFVAWQQWLNEQMNVPSRSDYYMMQAACETRRTFSKNPNQIKIDGFKLTFGSKTQTAPVSREELIKQTKARWIGRMTAPIVVRENGKVVDTIVPPLAKVNNGRVSRDGRPSSGDNGERFPIPPKSDRGNRKNRKRR